MTDIPRRSALMSAVAVLTSMTAPAAKASASAPPLQKSGLKFEVFVDGNGEFRWRLKAANGRPIASSGEGYKAKAGCRNAIDVIKRGASTATVVELP